MKIVTLIENLKKGYTDLVNENGLSLYIERNSTRLLVDTGRTSNFIFNAQKLGIPLEEVDTVILSHGHYDHGGGLLPFLKLNSKAKVYMKRKALGDQYFHFTFLNKRIGIDKKIFEQYSDRIYFTDRFTEVTNGIYIITDIEKIYKNFNANSFLFTKEKNRFVKDTFEHELIIAIKDDDGISIFTGCSHSGIANMIQTAKNTFPDDKIKALIGGFHLVKIPLLNILSAPSAEINILARQIVNANIEKVYTGHCTGKKAFKELKSILGNKIDYIKTGSEIYI